MNDTQRVIVLQRAIRLMSKVLRDHPVVMDWYLEDPDRIAMLTGGSARDPQGEEIASYFVLAAHKELTEEGVI
jgi:hypothetical protein